ncbi:unnamed protein product [Linum tenue]|uniref:Uncharacterized protein n=1 Tax=Linum tenue TaxID=586396 RepID=A0AAV0NT67_9ROSI|nr:unnamed protein product [Linum tenue]
MEGKSMTLVLGFDGCYSFLRSSNRSTGRYATSSSGDSSQLSSSCSSSQFSFAYSGYCSSYSCSRRRRYAYRFSSCCRCPGTGSQQEVEEGERISGSVAFIVEPSRSSCRRPRT